MSTEPQILPQKQLLIVAICLKTSYESISIRYLTTDSHDIYIFARISLFQPYIMLLLQSCPTARIILINIDLHVTLDTLKFLSQASTDIMKERTKDRFIEQYRRFLLNLSNAPAPVDYTPRIPQGYGDKQLGYECYLIMDCSSETESSIISAKSVALQQALRYTALKHGIAFASISGLQHLLEAPDQIVDLPSGMLEEPPQPVLDLEDSASDAFKVHQRIPLGWDTYSKIMLVAKSLPHLPAGSCLREDVQIEEYDDLYTEWFDAIGPGENFYAQLRKLNQVEPKIDTIPISKPAMKTFTDIIQSIKGAS